MAKGNGQKNKDIRYRHQPGLDLTFLKYSSMFETAFKNIDDVLWKDAGCTSELDYTEQTSWLLFLKYLDALEHDKATESQRDCILQPRVARPALPWVTRPIIFPNPNGVASPPHRPPDATPLGLRIFSHVHPG